MPKINPIEKYSYLIGQKINKWTVLEIKNDKRACYAICICECGTIKEVNIYNLINNKSKDCGCGRREMLRRTRTKNLIGQRFGKLIAIELLPESNKFNRRLYRCKCDCGNEIIVPSSCLTTHHTLSCGCLLSYYNMFIDILLDKLNIQHVPEYVVNINNRNFRYDFYLKDYNLMIEYDGEQHYMPVKFGGISDEEALKILEKTQTYDVLKNQYCKENNINLLRIPYWEKSNIEKLINNHLQRLNGKGLV